MVLLRQFDHTLTLSHLVLAFKQEEVMLKKLLPIGSVVRLKDAQKNIMIIGILQVDSGRTDGEADRTFDYLAVLYPEGYIGPEFQYMFDHKDIEEVVFKGYCDEERTLFIERLEENYKDPLNFK